MYFSLVCFILENKYAEKTGYIDCYKKLRKSNGRTIKFEENYFCIKWMKFKQK